MVSVNCEFDRIYSLGDLLFCQVCEDYLGYVNWWRKILLKGRPFSRIAILDHRKWRRKLSPSIYALLVLCSYYMIWPAAVCSCCLAATMMDWTLNWVSLNSLLLTLLWSGQCLTTTRKETKKMALTMNTRQLLFQTEVHDTKMYQHE